MRYERGEILGLFCGELGIPATARVSIAPLYKGLCVWNLDSGLEFTIKSQGSALSTTKKSVPGDCLHIFRQDDHTLLSRIADPNLAPWSEERETILSELHYRNLARREHLRYPLRLALPSLLSSLLRPLNPLRLFQRSSDLGSHPCNESATSAKA